MHKFIAMTVDLFGQHPSWAKKLETPVVLWEVRRSRWLVSHVA